MPTKAPAHSVELQRFIPMDVINSPEYQAVEKFYEGKVAKRSGVAYLSHINEGINILHSLNASERVMRAFAIHPIIQDSQAFKENLEALADFDPVVVALATEYRNTANGYLSKDFTGADDVIKKSPLDDVNLMLAADKAQNFRDLRRYNQDHPRFEELSQYFRNWLNALSAR